MELEVDSITSPARSFVSFVLLLNNTVPVLSRPSYTVMSSENPSILPALKVIDNGKPVVEVNTQNMVSLFP